MITLSPKKWKRRDLIMFFERLELYASSGLPINTALDLCAEGSTKLQYTQLQGVKKLVESGAPLSKSLATYLHMSRTTSGLVERGESSGEISKALLSARLLFEREDELIKKTTSAMIYPAVIGIFAVLLTIGLVRGVMPQIIPMLKSLHVQLPLLTRIVISATEILTSYGIYVAVGTVLVVVSLVASYRKFTPVKKYTHNIILHIPLLGKLVWDYSLTVFLGSLGTLIESGLVVDESYVKTVSVLSFIPLKNILQTHQREVSRGFSVSVVFKHKRFPSYIGSLLRAGEASGTLGISILRAAKIIDRDIEHMLKKLTSLIEPLMMVGMGGTVGAIALSIMMPIYDISKVLQH